MEPLGYADTLFTYLPFSLMLLLTVTALAAVAWMDLAPESPRNRWTRYDSFAANGRFPVLSLDARSRDVKGGRFGAWKRRHIAQRAHLRPLVRQRLVAECISFC